jgi:hypothetical protein
MSPFWRLEFLSGFYIFGKCAPLLKEAMFFQITGNRLPIDADLHPTKQNPQSHLVKTFKDLITKF